MVVNTVLKIGTKQFNNIKVGQTYDIQFKSSINKPNTLKIILPPYWYRKRNRSLLSEDILVGEEVIYKRGYDGELYTRFIGYVHNITDKDPFEIECYGEFYYFFHSSELKNFKSITFKEKTDEDILKYYLDLYNNSEQGGKKLYLIYLNTGKYFFEKYYSDISSFGVAIKELSDKAYFDYFIQSYPNQEYDYLVIIPRFSREKIKTDLQKLRYITPEILDTEYGDTLNDGLSPLIIQEIEEMAWNEWFTGLTQGEAQGGYGWNFDEDFINQYKGQIKNMSIDTFAEILTTEFIQNNPKANFNVMKNQYIKPQLKATKSSIEAKSKTIIAEHKRQNAEQYDKNKFNAISEKDKNIFISDDLIIKDSNTIRRIPAEDKVVIVNIKYSKTNRGRGIFVKEAGEALEGISWDDAGAKMSKEAGWNIGGKKIQMKGSTMDVIDNAIEEYNETGVFKDFSGRIVRGSGSSKYEITLYDIDTDEAQDIADDITDYFSKIRIQGSISIFANPFIQVGQWVDLKIKDNIYTNLFVDEIEETFDGGFIQTLIFNPEPPYNEEVDN